MKFVTEHFNGRVSSSNLSPHLHVILHAGLARRCRIHSFFKGSNTFLLGEEMPASADEGWGKFSYLALTHRLRRSPLSPRKSVIFDDGFCNFAFGSAQNDRVGIGMSESFLD